MTKTEYKYIRFQEMQSPRKTRTFLVINRTSMDALGTIKWYAPWRRYCFFIRFSDLVFDAGCLSDIQDFLTQLMAERKMEKNKKELKNS